MCTYIWIASAIQIWNTSTIKMCWSNWEVVVSMVFYSAPVLDITIFLTYIILAAALIIRMIEERENPYPSLWPTLKYQYICEKGPFFNNNVYLFDEKYPFKENSTLYPKSAPFSLKASFCQMPNTALYKIYHPYLTVYCSYRWKREFSVYYSRKYLQC